MSETIWPTTFNDQKYNEPQQIQNKWIINDQSLIKALENEPKLWNHMVQNKSNLSANITEYMDNISYKYQQTIPNKSFGRIIVPQTQWQEELEHQFIIMEFIHCANYDNYILPFHNEEQQYCVYFVDIEKSMRTNEVQYFWDPDEEPNGTNEEFLWTSADNIQIIYTFHPDHDEKDQKLGFKDVLLCYMKMVNGVRLDEIYESSFQFLSILIQRLRGKMRNGKHGCVISVQSTGTDSIIDTLLDKLEEVTTEDSNYSDKTYIKSFKLTRHLLFGTLKIHSAYIIKIYNEYGKELRQFTSLVKDCNIFDEGSAGYTSSIKSLLSNVMNKNKKKNIIPYQYSGFNGLRATINLNNKNIKLTTNVFVTKLKMDKIDVAKNKFPIKTTLGRKGGW
eukprot:117126_1